MTGVEIGFVVPDCKKALELYESIFEVQRVETTKFDSGLNEAIFNIYGTRFHMLDENPEYNLTAPKEGAAQSMWINIVVPDIKETFGNAMSAGCKKILPITEMEAFGVSNAMFLDLYGYVWMIHQVHREVSFEERCRVAEEGRS